MDGQESELVPIEMDAESKRNAILALLQECLRSGTLGGGEANAVLQSDQQLAKVTGAMLSTIGGEYTDKSTWTPTDWAIWSAALALRQLARCDSLTFAVHMWRQNILYDEPVCEFCGVAEREFYSAIGRSA